MALNRAVFVDRDGVINEIVCFPELGLLDSPLNVDQFKILPDVPKAINTFNSLGIWSGSCWPSASRVTMI